jgi:hypothetical protein
MLSRSRAENALNYRRIHAGSPDERYSLTDAPFRICLGVGY